MAVISCLTGKMVKKHPTLDIWCRDDGAVLLPRAGWVYGSLDVKGYRRVHVDGKDHKVHRLIAETFIDNPYTKKTVDHINRIKDDNRVENLRWATSKEQADNRHTSEECLAKYGVRSCEDRNAYARSLYANNQQFRENQKENTRKWRLEHPGYWRKYLNKGVA